MKLNSGSETALPSQSAGPVPNFARLSLPNPIKENEPPPNSFLGRLSAPRPPVFPDRRVQSPQERGEELTAYLADEFNLELFKTLSSKQGNTFSPLPFFKRLYQQYEFVKENKNNSGLVLNRIKELRRNNINLINALPNNDPVAKQEQEARYELQFRYLLFSLCMLIRNEYEVDGEIKDRDIWRCLILIEQELENRLQGSDSREQLMREVRSVVLKRKFDFAKVRNHIKALSDTKAKLQYLIELQLEYNQQDLVDEAISHGFGRKCQLEIDTLKEIMNLEEHREDQTSPQTESEEATRNPEFTTARQVLAIHHLLDAAQANMDNKSAEARFIRFLTGRNEDAITKSITELRERGNPSDKRSRKGV